MQLAISIPFQKYEVQIFDVTTLKVECDWDVWGWKREFWSNCSLWTVLCLLQTVHHPYWLIHSFHLQVGGCTAGYYWCALWDILYFHREKVMTKTTTPHLSQPTLLCVLIMQLVKSSIMTYFLKTLSFSNVMLWISLQKKWIRRHLSWSMLLSLTNWLIHHHQ